MRTSGGLQIRDLLLHIPFDIGEFWSWLRFKFNSSALIVECKNYTQPLKPNQVVISNKYLGRKRLGQLGLVISRRGLGAGAKLEQKRIWNDENNLTVSLADEQLVRMLTLKDEAKDPALVVDAEIRRFLELLP